MKIIYDISVLGLAEFNPLAKTGVARVVENLLEELIEFSKCELSLCTSFSQLYPVTNALNSIKILEGSLSYYTKHPKLTNLSINHSTQLTQAAKKLVQSIQHLQQYYLLHHNEQIVDLQKNLYSILRDLQELPWSNSTSHHTFDIFHATFYPIPSELRDQRLPLKFLTIYDLIPILYPQWFGKNENDRNTQTIDSLDIEKDWVVCISQATKDDLCNYLPKLNPDRVFVTYLAADRSNFYPCYDIDRISQARDKYNIPNGHYLLGLSTLEPRKNLPHLVRCFAQTVTQQNISDLSLVLVGNPGWGFQSLIDEISRYDKSLRQRIILTGRVDDHDLPMLYSDALAFVYPSLYEGFGLPPLEAMACGTPVITSTTSSLPEVVGDSALLVDPQDEIELCDSILRIYNDSSLRERLSKKGIIQSQKFTWKKTAQETYNAYQYALSTL